MRAGRILLATVASLAAVCGHADDVRQEETAVLAEVFNDYIRTPSVFGGYQAETFAFANGGALLGHLRDRSVDDATFDQVVQLIRPALTRQNYVASSAPHDTDLLIFVTWGVTDGYLSPGQETDDPQQGGVHSDWYLASSLGDEANRRRDTRNMGNARLLGYREALRDHRDLRAWGVNGTVHDDLIADLEEPRYFVILTAFDFQAAWRQKRLVPLWSTRYNIAARGNSFTTALPDMSLFASRFFGRDSGGLVRRLNPTGTVNLGDLKILGAVPAPEPAK